MNDFYDRLTTWLAAGVSVLAGLIWRSNESKHRIAAEERKELAKRIGKLESDSISINTMDRIKEEWRDEMRELRRSSDSERLRMHAENLARFDKVDNSITRIHDRIDKERDAQ